MCAGTGFSGKAPRTLHRPPSHVCVSDGHMQFEEQAQPVLHVACNQPQEERDGRGWVVQHRVYWATTFDLAANFERCGIVVNKGHLPCTFRHHMLLQMDKCSYRRRICRRRAAHGRSKPALRLLAKHRAQHRMCFLHASRPPHAK